MILLFKGSGSFSNVPCLEERQGTVEGALHDGEGKTWIRKRANETATQCSGMPGCIMSFMTHNQGPRFEKCCPG